MPPEVNDSINSMISKNYVPYMSMQIENVNKTRKPLNHRVLIIYVGAEAIPQYCYFEIWITASHKKNFSTNEREKMEK